MQFSKQGKLQKYCSLCFKHFLRMYKCHCSKNYTGDLESKTKSCNFYVQDRQQRISSFLNSFGCAQILFMLRCCTLCANVHRFHTIQYFLWKLGLEYVVPCSNRVALRGGAWGVMWWCRASRSTWANWTWVTDWGFTPPVHYVVPLICWFHCHNEIVTIGHHHVCHLERKTDYLTSNIHQNNQWFL